MGQVRNGIICVKFNTIKEGDRLPLIINIHAQFPGCCTKYPDPTNPFQNFDPIARERNFTLTGHLGHHPKMFRPTGTIDIRAVKEVMGILYWLIYITGVLIRIAQLNVLNRSAQIIATR